MEDDPAFKRFHMLGGIAAWLVAALTLLEVVAFALFPQPATVEGWFALFQGNLLAGLLDFWILELPMYVALVVVFLALYFALRQVDEPLMALALIFVVAGASIFFATNNPFTMLSLSSQYAAAATDAQRTALIGAGQALVANTGQRAVGGFNAGLFLVSIAGLIVATVMLRSASFGRRTGWLGVAAFALSLADYLREALTRSPIVALLVILPNALLLVIWFVAVGRRLHHLGKGSRAPEPAARTA